MRGSHGGTTGISSHCTSPRAQRRALCNSVVPCTFEQWESATGDLYSGNKRDGSAAVKLVKCMAK